MSGGPQHAGSQLPQASHGNDPSQGGSRTDAQPGAQHSRSGPRIPPKHCGGCIPWHGVDAFERGSVTGRHLIPRSLPTRVSGSRCPRERPAAWIGAGPGSVPVPTVQPPTAPGRASPYLSHTGSPQSPRDSSK